MPKVYFMKIRNIVHFLHSLKLSMGHNFLPGYTITSQEYCPIPAQPKALHGP
jgi:hypothetical protein